MPPKVDAQSCNALLTLRQCTALLKPLLKSESATAFLEPVDPVMLQLPDYLTVITQPMDLGTIQNKLNTSQYASAIRTALCGATIATAPSRCEPISRAPPLAVPTTDATLRRLCPAACAADISTSRPSSTTVDSSGKMRAATTGPTFGCTRRARAAHRARAPARPAAGERRPRPPSVPPRTHV